MPILPCSTNSFKMGHFLQHGTFPTNRDIFQQIGTFYENSITRSNFKI